MVQAGDPRAIEALVCILGGGAVLAACGALLSTRAARAPGSRRSGMPDRAQLAARLRRSRRAPATKLAAAAGVRPFTVRMSTRPLAADESAASPRGNLLLSEGPRRARARRTEDRALARLGDELHEHRRRGAARTRLGEDLGVLDRTLWHVERDIICRGVTMPFVIFGPSGLFAFSASHEWAFTDLAYLDRLSRDLGAMISGYPDPVRTGMYLPCHDVPARAWFDGRGRGGWIVGRGRLLEFFERFDDQDFSATDLTELRARLAGSARLPPTMRLRSQPHRG
jgi:hypothetical protein